MGKLKIAVIGVGNISECHINSYKKNDDVELYAFCDIDAEKLKRKGEKHGVTRLYTDEAQMLAELPEIDAVSVCTWNAAHAPCTIMALEAGKHVLCEKPMALNAKEAQSMIDASKKAHKKLMVGFVRRFGDDALVAKEFIDSGSLGDIYYSKATYLRKNGCPGGWFGNKEFSGGGPLIDLGVHVIDLVRYLMGCPKPVSVFGATFDKIGKRENLHDAPSYTIAKKGQANIFNVEDMATALIRFDNGSVLSIEAAFNMHIKEDRGGVEMYGSKGGMDIEPKFELHTEMNNYLCNVNLNKNVVFPFDKAFNNEINYYVDAIINDKDISSIAEDGCTLMKILDAIYKSAQTNHEVVID